MAEDNIKSSPGAEKLADEHGISIKEVYENDYYRSKDEKVLKSHVEKYLEDGEQDEGETYDVLNHRGQYIRTYEPSRHDDPEKEAKEFKKKHHPKGELRSPSVVPEKNRK